MYFLSGLHLNPFQLFNERTKKTDKLKTDLKYKGFLSIKKSLECEALTKFLVIITRRTRITQAITKEISSDNFFPVFCHGNRGKVTGDECLEVPVIF